VAAREDDPGKKRLVAYVVGVAGTEVSTAQLREFLREQLPEYMVPSAFVLLDSLPTTPSGKVDRRALPVPDRNRPDLVNAYVQPQNPSEVLLAKIWSEVLKLEKVGIHDNFFDLGGHSLMATMVMSRISEVFRLEPALRALFETPTIAGLSAHIEALRSAADENPGASQTNPDLTEAIVL
jgi:acyl carrier protein